MMVRHIRLDRRQFYLFEGSGINSPPLRHPSAPRLFENSAEWLRLRPRIPPGQRSLPDRLPVRGVDPAHLVRLPEGGGGNRRSADQGQGKRLPGCACPRALSPALLDWKVLQEGFKGRRILAPGGITFAASQFVFAGYSGAPFSNRAFNLRLRAACRALGVGEITAHGLRHSAATILLNQVGKDLREIQELLRHKNIRTTVRYTHVGYEQTRQTAEALSQALE